ncbi:MAG: carboxypeptidase-like regulatory domain-containing protein [Acidobacteriota bacterium]|nr:carboxypeptidase-like regulatory domain-containing protein [Acidobacteriota bacterium]
MKFLQILVLILGLAISGFGQSLNKFFTLNGTVYDVNKAVVVGTEILVKDTKNKTYKTKSDDNGKYEIILPAGVYTVEFSQTGFKIVRIINLEINSEIKKALDVTLEVGRCEDCNGALYGHRSDEFATLSGSVYDANGALIVRAKVTAISAKGEKFETVTNDTGTYVLNLPFNLYNSKADFKIAKYEITVTKEGFEKNFVKDFKFVPSSEGKMNFDFALDVFVNINTITINSSKNKFIKRKKINKQ